MSERLSIRVDMDETLTNACKAFDFPFNGESFFSMPRFNAMVRDGSWNIGLIVGPSGSGKSQILRKHYQTSDDPTWDKSKAIISQIEPKEKAVDLLLSVGLNSVPSWCRPYHVLSNGEQYRARIARTLRTDAVFDEFTSVVDRTVAASSCNAIQKAIRRENITGVVFASCHYDIIPWLKPDWIFDTLKAEFLPRGSLQCRPQINITVEPCHRSLWSVFKSHHYLSADLNSCAETYAAYWDDSLVAFTSCLALPHANIKNGYREHRTVCLPDYQGLGIGVRVSDWLAEFNLHRGRRYYSRTSHKGMGEYRNKSPLWKKTSSNGKASGDHSTKKKDNSVRINNPDRIGYSHEYIGSKT